MNVNVKVKGISKCIMTAFIRRFVNAKRVKVISVPSFDELVIDAFYEKR